MASTISTCNLTTNQLLANPELLLKTVDEVATCTSCKQPIGQHTSPTATNNDNSLAQALVRDRALTRQKWRAVVDDENKKRDAAPTYEQLRRQLKTAVEKDMITPELFIVMTTLVFQDYLNEETIRYMAHSILTACVSQNASLMLTAHNVTWGQQRQIMERVGEQVTHATLPIMPVDDYAEHLEAAILHGSTVTGGELPRQLPRSFKLETSAHGGETLLAVREGPQGLVADATVLEEPVWGLANRLTRVEQLLTQQQNHRQPRYQQQNQRSQQNYHPQQQTYRPQRQRGRGYTRGGAEPEEEEKDKSEGRGGNF